MINKKKKHAEITTTQIVLLIVLIASFVIIVYFLVRLNPGRETESQICHTSVVTRSSNFLTKQIVKTPINCKTDYICLSKDGSCEKMTSPEIKKVKTKEEVYEALADEAVDCWWKFGEGKLDYVGTDLQYDINGPKPKLYCSICSQVAFDDSLYSMFVTDLGIPDLPASDYPSLISKQDFYNYLANTNVPGKEITYLDYFLGLTNSELISDALESNNYVFGYIDVKKQHLIMMGEFSVIGTLDKILNGFVAGVFGAVTLPLLIVGNPLPIQILVAQISPFGQGEGYLLGTVMQGESEHFYLSPSIIEANSEDYEKLKCEDVTTLA